MFAPKRESQTHGNGLWHLLGNVGRTGELARNASDLG